MRLVLPKNDQLRFCLFFFWFGELIIIHDSNTHSQQKLNNDYGYSQMKFTQQMKDYLFETRKNAKFKCYLHRLTNE